MIKLHYKKNDNSWELGDKTFPTMDHAVAHAKSEGHSHYKVLKITELANLTHTPKKKVRAVQSNVSAEPIEDLPESNDWDKE